jgi:hypothetical protein
MGIAMPKTNAPQTFVTRDRIASLSKTHCANESAIVGLTPDGGSTKVSGIVQDREGSTGNLRRCDHAKNARSIRRILCGHSKKENSADRGCALDVNTTLISHDLYRGARDESLCSLCARAAEQHRQSKQAAKPGS